MKRKVTWVVFTDLTAALDAVSHRITPHRYDITKNSGLETEHLYVCVSLNGKNYCIWRLKNGLPRGTSFNPI